MNLYGDDFDSHGIRTWFNEEASYHNQFKGGRYTRYPFMDEVANYLFALKNHFRPSADSKVLDFGCAEGLALKRMLQKKSFQYYGVDASKELLVAARDNLSEGTFAAIDEGGSIPYPSDTFDYIVVWGVLHHIPNVSYTLDELVRVLKPHGKILIREPISSMGRPVGSKQFLPGLSPNERGIPVRYFLEKLSHLGCSILSARYAYFAPLMYVLRKTGGIDSWSFWRAFFAVDDVLCRVFRHNDTYVRDSFWKKIAPSSVYLVAEKV